MRMKKKIFFFGTPEIAVPSLKAIAELDMYEIIGVGVFPDRKIGRKQILTPCPVKSAAVELEIPIYEIENKNDLVHIFEDISFDLAIVIAFGMIFPRSIFELRDTAKWNIVNVHFSLLPEYRGASPVQAAIVNGDPISGLTWQEMVYRMDAGDVLFQKEYHISNKKTSELWEYFSLETALLFPDFLASYFNGNIESFSQQDLIENGSHSLTRCGMIEKSDGIVDPENETAEQIYQKYLAYDVWPGVEIKNLKIEGIEIERLKLKKITLDESKIPEKTISKSRIDCLDETFFYIEEAQVPGKNTMKWKDILSGLR